MNASVHSIPAATHTAMINFGMTQQEFRARYFEKNFCLLRGALQAAPFSWQDVDEVLYRADPATPYFKLFKDGEVAMEEFTDNEFDRQPRINKAKFYAYLKSGASVVMNRLESSSLAAQRLCQHVGRFAGHPTIGNAYLSFGGKGTFGKHWDTHDVFVIQLLGKKRWQVFAPTFPNPLTHQTSLATAGQPPPMESVLDCELVAGDVLYLPRGWWHQAIPCDGGSFHLSVGTYAPTAMEFLQWVCHRHLSSNEAARVGLTGDAQQLDVASIVATLGSALRDPAELATFHRSLIERERVSAEFDLQSLASSTKDDATAELPDDTSLCLNSCYPITFNGPHIVINRTELRLESLRRMIVLNLDKAPKTLRSLYACVPAVPRTAVRAAVLDLAQYDILSIRRPA